MKNLYRFPGKITYLLIISLFLSSCITYQYIRDEESFKMQKEIQGKRAGNVAGDSFLTLLSTIFAAFTGIYAGYIPREQSYRHIALLNKSTDTLQVNMFTNQLWKDSSYFDFRDIRIPPGDKCRLLVPVNSVYNLYFSNTINSQEDDEMIEFNTSEKSKIILYPGMTLQNGNDTIQNNVNPEK